MVRPLYTFLLFMVPALSGNESDRTPVSKGVELSGPVHLNNPSSMGITITLHRVGKAARFEDLGDINTQLTRTFDTRLPLDEAGQDLAMLFTNNIEPFLDRSAPHYKMLYGIPLHARSIPDEIGAFLPSSEIPAITKWIKDNQLHTYPGYSKMYEALSPEVKAELQDISPDIKTILYNGYLRPLVVFYFTALENENSVVFIGR